MAEFVVIDGRSAYNAIFGRPIIHSFRVVPSTLHQVLKYSTPNGVGTVRGEQTASRECYASALKGSSVCALEAHASGNETLEFKADLPRREFSAPTEELELVPLLSLEKQVFNDSQLVVSQIKDEYQAKDTRMEKYLGKVRSYLAQFLTYEVSRIPRAENSNADALAKLASAYETDLARSVPVEILDNPSISEPDLMEIGAPESSWMDPIADFIRGNSPQDPKERRKLAWRVARFVVRDGALYRRGFSLPLLRCLTPEEGLYVLREVHEGVCGNHSGARSLSAKVIRQGYYWPTLSQDAKKFVRTCDNCQRYGNVIHQPPELLTPISASWPFRQWGVDIIGPFPLGKGQTKFAVVAVDYFTKWAEVEALSHITESRVTSFVWTNIICRFGIPKAIVTDNGKQFDNAKFKDFCSKLGISHLRSSPAQQMGRHVGSKALHEKLEARVRKIFGKSIEVRMLPERFLQQGSVAETLLRRL
ncbi:protein NYNRIN-like [Momordica charantia]|uniref:Protein NYNRIN-like n=1 Tax=Momordica charantia TaxID=3673 RepID=A0A6J1DYS0_MOMCH|nr:protein NYNRIN-like [Momordica charantia]